MRVALICIDKPNAQEIRLANRAAHLEYLKTTGVVEMAGPFLKSEAMVGSLLVLEVEDLQAAKDWAANDPYAKAGLFSSVDVRAWKKVIG